MLNFKTVALVYTAMFGACSAMAALPPNYQRQNEITTVVEDAASRGEIVTQVSYVGPDQYEVKTENGTYISSIVNDYPEGEPVSVGPRRFKVEVKPDSVQAGHLRAHPWECCGAKVVDSKDATDTAGAEG